MDAKLVLPTAVSSSQAADDDADGALRERKTAATSGVLLRPLPRDTSHAVLVANDRDFWPLPGSLREADSGEASFPTERHPDEAVYLDDPAPAMPHEHASQTRNVLRMRNRVVPTSAVAWMSAQPPAQWKRLLIANGEKGKLKVKADYLTRQVWIWDGKAPSADARHLLVRRAMDGARLQFYLFNAKPETSLQHLAEMQARVIPSSAPRKLPKRLAAWHW